MPRIEEYPGSGIHFRIFTIYGMELVWGVRAGRQAGGRRQPDSKAAVGMTPAAACSLVLI